MGIFARLKDLQPELHQALWGAQSFYRVLSTVNGGRQREVGSVRGAAPLTAPARLPRQNIPWAAYQARRRPSTSGCRAMSCVSPA